MNIAFRTIALRLHRLLGITVLIMLFFALLFMTAEAGHDCNDDDCLICACLEFCENTFRQTGSFPAQSPLFMLFPAQVLLFVCGAGFDLLSITPVSHKVRLNN